jgi:hypothetical protein
MSYSAFAQASVLEGTALAFAQDYATENAERNAAERMTNRSALVIQQAGWVAGAIPEPEIYYLVHRPRHRGPRHVAPQEGQGQKVTLTPLRTLRNRSETGLLLCV